MKEFKVVKIDSSEIYHVFREDDFSGVEEILERYSADGWDVVSVCPDNYINNVHGNLLVTLQREKLG